jgi:signal transduction histidine kinase
MKIKRFWGTLRNKITALLIGLLLVLFALEAVILVSNNTVIVRKNLIIQAKAFATLSTQPIMEAYNLYYQSGNFKFQELVKKDLELDKNIYRVQIIDVNGNVSFDSLEFNNPKLAKGTVDSLIKEKVTSDTPSYLAEKNPRQVDEIIIPYFDDWGGHSHSVRYFVSYQEVRQMAAFLSNIIIAISIGIMLVSMTIITQAINRLIIRPVEIVQTGAQRISRGNFDYQIEVKTGDEIEALAESTNKMARTLAQNIIELKNLDKLKDEFVDIAAHNLRTPITHIKYDLDYLTENSSGFNTKQKEILSDILNSNERMSLLAEDLLNMSTLIKGELRLVSFQPMVIKPIIDEVLTNYKAAIKEKIIKIDLNLDQDLPEVLADPPKIKEVIANILDNAIKFSRPQNKIIINLKKVDQGLQFSIQDFGPGISKEEMPLLFTKFHRATDITKSYDYEGTGLGLYISRLIIEAHQGKIWTVSEEGKGSTFYFTLPIKGKILPKTVGE